MLFWCWILYSYTPLTVFFSRDIHYLAYTTTNTYRPWSKNNLQLYSFQGSPELLKKFTGKRWIGGKCRECKLRVCSKKQPIRPKTSDQPSIPVGTFTSKTVKFYIRFRCSLERLIVIAQNDYNIHTDACSNHICSK